MSKIISVLVSLAVVAIVAMPWHAVQAEGSCFCTTVSKDSFGQLPDTTDPTVLGNTMQYDSVCYDLVAPQCAVRTSKVDSKYTECAFLNQPSECQGAMDDWKKAKDDAAQRLLSGTRAKRTELHNKGVIEKLLPSCVFEADVSGDCRHINVFIKVGIDIADYILSIVGALALVVFIYGGILMIISEGSSDRVQQGKNAMVAAFIGLIIIFGAYILVKFVAGVVGVQSGFNLQ
jgi:hypothetical protein